MKDPGSLVVLAYLMVATFAEAYLATTMPPGLLYYAVLGALAISEAIVIGAYYMRLKGEPLGVKMVAAVGIFFIITLIVAMLFVYV